MKQKNEPQKKLTLQELKNSSNKKNFDQIISDLKYILATSAPVERACRFAGINHDTYYAWIKKSDEFAAEMEKAQDSLYLKSYRAVHDAVESDNSEKAAEMAIKFLERREKKLWSLRSELTGADGDPIEFKQDLSKLTDEELKQLSTITAKITS